MYTDYKFNGKTYQFNTEASLKMGKDAFIKAYQGKVPNANLIWEKIEADSLKEEKVPQTKPDGPKKTK